MMPATRDSRSSTISRQFLAWFLLVVVSSLAVIGLVFPTWAYLSVRPAVGQLLDSTVGVGPGVWLNGLGHIQVAAASLILLLGRRKLRPEPVG